jgi:GNAT superfamily N-acetyltransferase
MPHGAITLLESADPLAAELASLHAAEWGHLYKSWDGAAAQSEFRTHKTDGSLPATLVLRQDGRMTGVVSLIHGDCEARTDLDPWLASLYVVPEFRGRGYAHDLIDAAIRHASAAGVKALHVFTESAEELFQRHGFTEVERTTMHGQPIVILKRELP